MYCGTPLIRSEDTPINLITCTMLYLCVYFTSCSRADVHENFRKRVEAICVQYDQDKNMLTVLVGYGMSNEGVIFDQHGNRRILGVVVHVQCLSPFLSASSHSLPFFLPPSLLIPPSLHSSLLPSTLTLPSPLLSVHSSLLLSLPSPPPFCIG